MGNQPFGHMWNLVLIMRYSAQQTFSPWVNHRSGFYWFESSHNLAQDRPLPMEMISSRDDARWSLAANCWLRWSSGNLWYAQVKFGKALWVFETNEEIQGFGWNKCCYIFYYFYTAKMTFFEFYSGISLDYLYSWVYNNKFHCFFFFLIDHMLMWKH